MALAGGWQSLLNRHVVVQYFMPGPNEWHVLKTGSVHSLVLVHGVPSVGGPASLASTGTLVSAPESTGGGGALSTTLASEASSIRGDGASMPASTAASTPPSSPERGCCVEAPSHVPSDAMGDVAFPFRRHTWRVCPSHPQAFCGTQAAPSPSAARGTHEPGWPQLRKFWNWQVSVERQSAFVWQ
jgi:hypothetical protein